MTTVRATPHDCGSTILDLYVLAANANEVAAAIAEIDTNGSVGTPAPVAAAAPVTTPHSAGDHE